MLKHTPTYSEILKILLFTTYSNGQQWVPGYGLNWESTHLLSPCISRRSVIGRRHLHESFFSSGVRLAAVPRDGHHMAEALCSGGVPQGWPQLPGTAVLSGHLYSDHTGESSQVSLSPLPLLGQLWLCGPLRPSKHPLLICGPICSCFLLMS